MTDKEKLLAFADSLETESHMINMGERIPWGNETAKMDRAAAVIRELVETLVDINEERKGISRHEDYAEHASQGLSKAAEQIG